MAKQRQFETRIDLYETWIIIKWFDESMTTDNEFRKRLFLIWVKLFMALYNDLNEKVPAAKKRDSIFLYFVNEVFPNTLDNYKWYESEKRGSDMGLLDALENISMEEWYIDLLSKFSQVY